MKTLFLILPILSSLLLAGCVAIGPDYTGPESVTHAATFSQADRHESHSPDLEPWWKSLGNTPLNRLVEESLAENLDVAISVQRLQESRAMRKRVASAILPSASANASYTRLNPGTITGGGSFDTALPGFQLDDAITYWNSGFDIAWELDVFGGKRREIRGAAARQEAAHAVVHGVRQALAAEVVETWFAIAGLREQLSTVKAQIRLQSSQTDDIRERVDAGAASQLDLDRSIARLEQTKLKAPPLEAGIVTQKKRLALLAGREPSAFDQKSDADFSLPDKLPMTRAGLPAELLLRRPDLIEAERLLAAATEDIGVARANFYPKFKIGNTGPVAFGANPGDLFNASNYVWQFGPRIEWSIFQGGSNRALLEQANARQKAALLEYEKAVLEAVAEVETELANLKSETEQLLIVQKIRAANADAVRRVRENHEAGASAYIEVLIEEEALREFEITEIRVKNQMIQVWVRLHKALGGGWQ